jgi:hypothetical protein
VTAILKEEPRDAIMKTKLFTLISVNSKAKKHTLQINECTISDPTIKKGFLPAKDGFDKIKSF